MERGYSSPVVVEMNVLFRRLITFFVGFAVWMMCTVRVSADPSKPPDCTIWLWAAPLLVGNDEGEVRGRLSEPTENGLEGVTFLDNDRLLVHKVFRTGEFSSRSNLNPSSAFRLHASIVDASSGKALFFKDWDTRAHDSSIRVTNGGVLVRTGQVIRFYSKDFVELDQMTLSQSDTDDIWIISVSTTGKTVMFNHYDGKESRFEIRDGSTFKQLKTWNGLPLRSPYSISDVGIATADSHQEHIVLTRFGSGYWQPLANGFNIGCVSSPDFVTDKILANAACNELLVITTAGEVLMTDRSEKHQSFSGRKIAVAKSGTVLAALLTTGRGGGLFDSDVHRTGVRVAVYDLLAKKPVITAGILPLPKRDYDFALSPDGSKLAILNDRRVSVCSVPVQTVKSGDPLR
jgi:hypothetical protein